jgi:hypothetical protein
MLTTNSSAVQQSILRARDQIEAKLKNMIVGFAADVAKAATGATPLGDAVQYASLYKLREETKGYKPIAGLAKGNWQYTESGSAVFVPNYEPNAAQQSIDSVKAEAKGSFKIGDTFYIANSLDYIGILERRRPGKGIMGPAEDILTSIYKINLKANYDAG